MPKSDEKVLFKNEDGFTVKACLGDVEYFADMLYSINIQAIASTKPHAARSIVAPQSGLEHLTQGP